MAAKGSKRKPGQLIAAWLMELKKFGLGEMTHPETARWIARVILFAHMEKMMVSSLGKLRGTCLLLYRELHELGRKMSPSDHSDFPALVIREVSGNTEHRRALYVESWSSLCEAAKHFPLAKELATEISEWTDGRHMKVDWFIDAVLINLCRWRMEPEAAKELRWSYPGSMSAGQNSRGGIDLRRLHGLRTLDRIIPQPLVKPYNPSMQTREEHQQELEIELKGYYTKQEDFFAVRGFQRSIPKRARTVKDRPWLHFEWFINYQLQGRSGTQIAEKYQRQAIGPDAIHYALGDLATLLQVTLRPQVKNFKQKLNKKKLNS